MFGCGIRPEPALVHIMRRDYDVVAVKWNCLVNLSREGMVIASALVGVFWYAVDSRFWNQRSINAHFP